MKEFDGAPEPIHEGEVREVHKTKLLGQMVVQRGLVLWEFNPETKVLEEAEFVSTIAADAFKKKHERTTHKVLNQKAGCIYFQALNRKNAMRKLDRLKY